VTSAGGTLIAAPAEVRDARSTDEGAGVRAPGPRLLALPTAWPLYALLGGLPVWWALGLGQLVWLFMAVPMGWHLLRLRQVRFPPWFGLWALFLLWFLLALSVLHINPPGMLEESFSSRLLPWGLRLVSYLACTILFLFIGNLSERELPQRRLVGLLAWLFGVTVAGGIASMLFPGFEFTSPVELLLPSGAESNQYLMSLVHPALSQIQDVLGYDAPRPKAPFEYTNNWGNNLSLLGVFFVVWIGAGGVIRRPALRYAVMLLGLGVAAVPAIYSLNRGMWIGIALSVVYVAIRMALHGRATVLVGALFAVVLAGAALVASPLSDVISTRLDNGVSDQVRTSLTETTIGLANDSPVLGYGNVRTEEGSANTIAIGRTPDCPQCGNSVIGSNGQLFELLVTTGWGGAVLFMSFFGLLAWRYRNDVTPIGLAGVLVIVLLFLYSGVYNALVSVLAITFVSTAMLWRNDMARAEAGSVPSTGPVAPLSGGMVSR
jgi:hypothetical protein